MSTDDKPRNPSRALFIPEFIKKHESAVRSMIAKAANEEYVSFPNLDEARRNTDSALIFEGDWGGTIYLTIPVKYILCTEETLDQLLNDIDSICWKDADGASMFFEPLPVGSGVSGGMGGGTVVDGLWLHSDVAAAVDHVEIESVLSGASPRIMVGDRRWT